MLLPGVTLVVSPLISLMKDQVASLIQGMLVGKDLVAHGEEVLYLISIEQGLDVLGHVGDRHAEGVGLGILQEEVVKLVHEATGSKLDVAEVQHKRVFTTVHHQQLEVLRPHPALD